MDIKHIVVWSKQIKMGNLRINNRSIPFEDGVDYLSIGDVGRETIGGYHYRPAERLGYELRSRSGFLSELKAEKKYLEHFLATGESEDRGPVHLTESDQPAIQRSAELFEQVIRALSEK